MKAFIIGIGLTAGDFHNINARFILRRKLSLSLTQERLDLRENNVFSISRDSICISSILENYN